MIIEGSTYNISYNFSGTNTIENTDYDFFETINFSELNFEYLK